MKNRLLCIFGITFSGLSLLDLILTTMYFEYEINPLVKDNYPTFYVIKMLTTWIILSLCIYKLNSHQKIYK